MKKSKLLAGVLVASMALLGTGYAYWTDTLIFNATLETGNLNVKYVAAPTLETGELQEAEKGDDTSLSDPIPISDPSQLPPGAVGLWNPVSTNNYKSGTFVRTSSNSDSIRIPNKNDNNNSKKVYRFYGDIGKDRPKALNGHEYFKFEPKTDKDNPYGYPAGWYTQGLLPGCFWTDDSCKYYVISNSAVTFDETIVQNDSGYINKYATGTTAEIIADTNNKGVKISLNNYYPGSFASATFLVENDGSIPAVIDTITATGLDQMKEDNGLSFANKLKVVVKVGNEDAIFDAVTDNEISNAENLSKIEEVLKNAYGDKRLEPGEKIKTRITIIFPGATSTNNQFEDLTGESAQTFGLEINWIQHNALKTKTEKPEA